MIWRRINSGFWLYVFALYLPGVSIQCKASCTMPAVSEKAAVTFDSNCCGAGHTSHKTHRDNSTLRDSHEGCCRLGVPIPAGITEASSLAGAITEVSVLPNSACAAGFATQLGAGAFASADFFPLRVPMPSTLGHTTSLRI